MRRKGWTEPELPIGPTDLALVAQSWEAPEFRAALKAMAEAEMDATWGRAPTPCE